MKTKKFSEHDIYSIDFPGHYPCHVKGKPNADMIQHILFNRMGVEFGEGGCEQMWQIMSNVTVKKLPIYGPVD